MTFMLKDTGNIDPNGPILREQPGWGERVSAQFRLDRVSSDSMSLQSRAAERDLFAEMESALGPEPEAAKPQRRYHSEAERYAGERDRALSRIAELRAFDPDTFGQLPASREEFDQEVLRRRRVEAQELVDLLDAAPVGGWAPELVGSLGAGVRDE